jgi:predicted nucleic acid-binding protein
VRIVGSELTVLETLTKPFQMGDATMEALFRALLGAREVVLVPVNLTLWEDAARIRASTRMKTPDALHAATALATACELFVTNDSGFRRIQGLPVAVLQDLVAST